MNPIATMKTTNKKIVSSVRQKLISDSEKIFYPKPLSFYSRLFFDVDNFLKIFQRESEKTI